MYKEETEIQIKLAELQADIQIYLTFSFGLFAAIVAIAALVFQILPSLTENVFSVIAAIILIMFEFVLAYYTNKAIGKLKFVRTELRKLREKYVW